MLNPVKVRWPNLSCWGSRSHAANTRPPPARDSLPTHSARALNCLFNLTHNYRGNICVFCTSATARRRKPPAKSSQLPLQLSQPESPIKTRCFHLGQLGKKTAPRVGPACQGCPLQAVPCVAPTEAFEPPPFALVSIQMCY